LTSKILRNARRSRRVRLDGETVWEVFTPRDKLPVGIAVARIVRSEPHFHRKTHEWYITIRGTGIVKVGRRRLRLRRGSILHIRPGMVHTAERLGSKPFEIIAVSYPPWSARDHVRVKFRGSRGKR
jgi:mannose-6-phosphate isomerase-like protein (cupin superfamily)